VRQYAALIGDFNPLHLTPTNPRQNGEKTKREEDEEQGNTEDPPIVHGMLVSSVFSSVFGTLVPGCVYRSQTLTFRSPARVGEAVTGRLEVIRARAMRGKGILVTCSTTISVGMDEHRDRDAFGEGNCNGQFERVCVLGEADVWLPGAMRTTASAGEENATQ